jgi:hypothetical protein
LVFGLGEYARNAFRCKSVGKFAQAIGHKPGANDDDQLEQKVALGGRQIAAVGQ